MNIRLVVALGVLAILGISAASAAPDPFAAHKIRSCPTDQNCTLCFPRLGKGTRWELRQVSCIVNTGPASVKVLLSGVAIHNEQRESVANYPVAAENVGVSSGVRSWILQTQIYAPVFPKQRPVFVVNLDSNPELFFIDCTLAGVKEKL